MAKKDIDEEILIAFSILITIETFMLLVDRAKKRKIKPYDLACHIWSLYGKIDENVIREYLWTSNY